MNLQKSILQTQKVSATVLLLTRLLLMQDIKYQKIYQNAHLQEQNDFREVIEQPGKESHIQSEVKFNGFN